MRVFVTGVSGGIGRELTKQLIKDGHEVWGIARRSALLSELQKEVDETKFHFSVGDVGLEKTADEVIGEMKKNNFLPDVVVLNAALFLKDINPQFDYKVLKRSYEVNVFGALIWVDKFINEFLERGSGKFVAISSTSAYRPHLGNVSLSSSKAALSMAFRGLRLHYKKDNIDFNNIYFGPVATSIAPYWQSASGGQRYSFVLTTEKAAQKILKVMNRRGGDYWFPFFTTLIFRLSLFVPDKFFSAITQCLKNK